MSNEQTFDVEEELGDIYKKFDEGKCIEILAPLTKGICSETHSNMRICPMNETVKNDEAGEDDKDDKGSKKSMRRLLLSSFVHWGMMK